MFFLHSIVLLTSGKYRLHIIVVDISLAVFSLLQSLGTPHGLLLELPGLGVGQVPPREESAGVTKAQVQPRMPLHHTATKPQPAHKPLPAGLEDPENK